MSKTNWQDPSTSEIRSTHIAGLMEAVGKIEESIGMQTIAETNIPLVEVFISSDDRYRIFQAPEGKRNWTSDLPPVIRKNGAIITSGFEIDYGGGAIILNVNDTVVNAYTANAAYTKKIEGKQLSTNDYATAEKNKLGLIQEEANKTVIANNLTETGVGKALDATQGKILKDMIENFKEEVFFDKTGSPGPQKLIAGNLDAGFFGTVSASELWTSTQLSTAVGISQGTIQFDDTPWLKFALDGKILFRPMKAFRHSISWDAINSAGCVFGTKTVTKNGHTYKVRLMKTGLVDPVLGHSGVNLHGSEWNRLILPIHIQAKDKSWVYPANVESNVPYWGIDFTDSDLHTHNSFGSGTYAWCQETYSSNRLLRGYNGVSCSNSGSPSLASSNYGWVPVVEWVS